MDKGSEYKFFQGVQTDGRWVTEMLNIINHEGSANEKSTVIYDSSLVGYYQRDRRMAGNVALLVDYLLSMYKALGLVFGITDKQTNKKLMVW